MSVTDFIALHLAFLCVRKREKEGERESAHTRESKGEFVCVCGYDRATELGSFRP